MQGEGGQVDEDLAAAGGGDLQVVLAGIELQIHIVDVPIEEGAGDQGTAVGADLGFGIGQDRVERRQMAEADLAFARSRRVIVVEQSNQGQVVAIGAAVGDGSVLFILLQFDRG